MYPATENWLDPEKKADAEHQLGDLKPIAMVTLFDGAGSSPVALVQKKDGPWILCINYRRLNEVTETDSYLLPQIDKGLNALCGSKYSASWIWRAGIGRFT